MDGTIQHIDPKQLKNHTLNIEIYGDKLDPEFVELTQDGIEEPIVCTPDMTVISGHRRRQAAIINKLKTVPVIVREDLKDEEHIQWLLIISNRQRVKTNEQLGREAKYLLELAGKRAKPGKKPGKTTDKVDSANGGTGSTNSTSQQNGSKTRDEVGKQLGVSGRTAASAAKVVTAIDELESQGETEQAEELRETLNTKGVRPAAEQASPKKPPKKPKKSGKNPIDVAFDKAEAEFGKWVRAGKALLNTVGGEGHHYSLMKATNDKLLKQMQEWRKEIHKRDRE